MTDQSSARRPRGVLKINGQIVSFLSFDITNNTHFTADRWRAELDCWNQPDGFDITYWEAAQDVQVECLIGLLDDSQDVNDAPADPSSLIIGQVDNIDVDPIVGTISLSGRDLTAKLIDMKVVDKWPDQVASQIVTTLAGMAGLTPQVTKTDTPVGQYSDNAYASLSRGIPAWDTVIFLAQQEGFDAYVTGTTLYFGPPQADDDPNPIAIQIARNGNGSIVSNATRIKFGRSLTLARDLSVTVISHGVKSGTIKATATRSGTKATISSSSKGANNVQNYTIRRPNLTQAQAQQLANNTLADLTKFERTMDVSMEGDPTISVRRLLTVSGTNTGFDQSYHIQEIERSYGFGAKFDMHIKAKNHPTESDSAL